MNRATTVFEDAWQRCREAGGRLVVAIGALLLASCGGELERAICFECQSADNEFYEQTSLTVDPGTTVLSAGQSVNPEANVVLIYPSSFPDGELLPGLTKVYELNNVSIVEPVTAGLSASLTPVATSRCAPADLPPTFDRTRPDFVCATFKLSVTATQGATVPRKLVLSAQWTASGRYPNRATRITRVIERIADFTVEIPFTLPPPAAPDFQIAVGAVPGGAYATVATLPVTITRVGGFAEDVTLDYFPLASGIGGGFVAEPVPTDVRSLQLQLPARYAGGGRVDLRVKATAAGGLTRTVDFPLFIDPLFRLELQPTAAPLTSAAPLLVDVGLEPGNAFRTTSLGAVELSISPDTPLPTGVTATFLDDATPVGPVLPVVKVWRRLRLVTDGRSGVMGSVTIRGTARGVPADVYGTAPFVETTLDLTVVAGQSWQFVGNNLTYGTTEANVIGNALQSDNRPAVAWLEGKPGRVYLRRYDGTTFAASPPRVDLGSGPFDPALFVTGGVDEASFALTALDAGQVAFTYGRGTRLALGRTGRASVEWSIAPPLVIGDPADATTTRARSPRVATAPASDTVVVSYIREANAATTTGGVLQVLRTFGNGSLIALPTSLPGGALNASPTGSVVLDATALALRPDGNPWVAWVEEPTDLTIAPRLLLRTHDGSEWGPVIAVPTTPGARLGSSVQLLVEPSGQVVVAWLEGQPAQAKVIRYDPPGQGWEPLDFTGNGRGSLNVTALSPAIDVHLARETGAQGRLLATWTEGDADPRTWIRRRDADGGWRLVGTTVSQVDRWAKTPRIVSDNNNRLYVAWATYAAGQNPGTFLPYADIDVAQWIFP